MKALVKSKPEPGIWMMDVPQPEMGHNDVLIKIKKTAICGTDIHIYNWDEWAQENIPVPLTIGHEFVGEIVDMGKEVKGFNKGDVCLRRTHCTGFCNCRWTPSFMPKNVSIGVTRTGCSQNI